MTFIQRYKTQILYTCAAISFISSVVILVTNAHWICVLFGLCFDESQTVNRDSCLNQNQSVKDENKGEEHKNSLAYQRLRETTNSRFEINEGENISNDVVTSDFFPLDFGEYTNISFINVLLRIAPLYKLTISKKDLLERGRVFEILYRFCEIFEAHDKKSPLLVSYFYEEILRLKNSKCLKHIVNREYDVRELIETYLEECSTFFDKYKNAKLFPYVNITDENQYTFIPLPRIIYNCNQKYTSFTELIQKGTFNYLKETYLNYPIEAEKRIVFKSGQLLTISIGKKSVVYPKDRIVGDFHNYIVTSEKEEQVNMIGNIDNNKELTNTRTAGLATHINVSMKKERNDKEKNKKVRFAPMRESYNKCLIKGLKQKNIISEGFCFTLKAAIVCKIPNKELSDADGHYKIFFVKNDKFFLRNANKEYEYSDESALEIISKQAILLVYEVSDIIDEQNN